MNKTFLRLTAILTALLLLLLPLIVWADGETDCDHEWSEELVERAEPTCFEEGLYVYICTLCYAQKNVIIPRTHVPGPAVRENEVPATCTQVGGYDSVVYCTTIDCGVEISRTPVEIPALGHTPGAAVQENVVDPTCTQAGGYETVTRCEVCGAEISRVQGETRALGHAMTYISAQEPTTGADGRAAYYRCSRCGDLFLDAYGRQPLVSAESLIIRQGNDGALTAFAGRLLQNTGDIQANSGAVENNYGTIAQNTGVVEHHFYHMTTEMDPGAYTVQYDGSFRSVPGDSASGLFLEAGQSGVITLTAPQGSRIARVTYVLNGQELVLEDLGQGRYRLTAPDMPEGLDGFAINEGCLRVELQEGAAADDGSWKSDSLRRLESQNASIDLFRVMSQDRSMNGDQPAIRVEGADLEAADAALKRAIAGRGDILNALAAAAFGSETGTVIFVLDDGTRIICDLARTGEVIRAMLPSVKYKTEAEEKQEELEKLTAELVNRYDEVFPPQPEDIKITLVFQEETGRTVYEEEKRVEPEIQMLDEPHEEPQSKKCLAPDTLILLADGAEKRVDQLLDTDRLLVWDFDAGCLAEAPLTFFHLVIEEAPVLRVSFSDGTSVGIVGEHVFFDLTARRFVAISSADQAADLVGHSFAKLADGEITEVTLTAIYEDGTVDSYYSPVTEAHFNCFANGMLNISGFMEGLYNVFDLEADALKYDAEKKAAELRAVGELPYEVFAELFPRELFERNQVGWLSVSVAKRLITLTDLYDLFAFCDPFFVAAN